MLTLGRALGPEIDADRIQMFFLAVNAWGYGSSGYGWHRSRRIAAHRDFIGSARRVLECLRDGAGAVDAYYYLNNAQGHVTGWGPAFFTKFLTFADPANQPGARFARDAALILDRWTAAAINHVLASDHMPPNTRRPSFKSSGWTTPQYAFYLRLLGRLRDGPGADSGGRGEHAMTVERRLFQYYRDGPGRTLID